jgi:GNAT superfamily N-acetyltransferase
MNPPGTATTHEGPSDPVARVVRTYLAQRALGFRTKRGPGFRVIRHSPTPLIYDANYVDSVEPGATDDPSRFFAALDEAHAGVSHRKVVCDPHTPPGVEALLAAHGFEPETVVQMVLRGPWAAKHVDRPVGLEITRVAREDHWAELAELQHQNFGERCRKQGIAPFERAVAVQMVESWRVKTDMAFWLARLDGESCAYIGSWPGIDGGGGERLGMVESLFTRPERRHLGIATALIAHGVADARTRGAETVLIGADIDDTPKQMYLALGFAPVCLTREWLRMERSV